MSQSRRMNLLKTLSKSDIDEVLDQYGTGQSQINQNFYGSNGDPFQNSNGSNIADAKLKTNITGLQEEWNRLFSQKNFIEQLKAHAIDGNIGTDNFRSICWRIFWECLSEDQSKWVEDVDKKRKRYEEIRNKYVIDPYEKEHIDLEIHHPLSQAEDSVWHQYFQDNELRDTIMQDLDRLFPEIQFFQQECVKSIILHILFCYARENPQVQYKQGMHEILAPLIYIMVLNGLIVKESNEDLSQEMKFIMDLTYLEHDAYALFFNIMESIEPWFANLQPLKGNQTTAISKKLTRIQCHMLKRYDMALRDHLEKIEVTPQLYGIRWLRLLFGREYSLSRLLILWDAIFAEGVDLVDYIFLSMLINLRGVLLQSDFSTCIGHLMKYPANTDTKYILKRAVTLRNKGTISEVIPSAVADHIENNTCSINANGKPVYYSNKVSDSTTTRRPSDTSVSRPAEPPSRRASDISQQRSNSTFQRPVVDNSQKSLDSSPQEQFTDPLRASEVNGMRAQRSSSIGKQFSNIKNHLGSTPQMISRLSDSLKTKNSRHLDSSSVDALIEDHAHLQKQVSELQTQVDRMGTISLFCGGKMDLYISILQQCLMASETCGELEVHTFAGLKQVRDILKDGLENCGTVPDYEDDFRDIDEHIADASNRIQQSESKDNDITCSTPSPIPLAVPAISDNVSTASYECDEKAEQESQNAKEKDCKSVDVMYFGHDNNGDNIDNGDNGDVKDDYDGDINGGVDNGSNGDINDKIDNSVKNEDGVNDDYDGEFSDINEINDRLTSSPVADKTIDKPLISEDASINLRNANGSASAGELDKLIEAAPPDLDPLSAFQIDLSETF